MDPVISLKEGRRDAKFYAVELSGFPQALVNLENQEKVPCMEKSWNLKKTE